MANQEEGLKFKPLLYRNSGDSPLGDRRRVVGYWAIAGHQKVQQEHSATLSDQDKSELLKISRSALESFIRTETIPVLQTGDLSFALKQPSIALVSLYMGDRLRGRIEFLTPAIPLGAMVQEMTIASATLDNRYAPVESSELDYITLEISVLSELKKITSLEEIDLFKHGIYLVKGEHTGLYLPGKAQQEAWTKEELLDRLSREKAGLGWDDWKEAELYIFETVRFSEADLNPSSSPALYKKKEDL